jgi:hypothetical protein
MNDKAIIVFTRNDTDTRRQYLGELRLGTSAPESPDGGLGEVNKKVAFVGFDSQGFAPDDTNARGIDIIIVHDEEPNGIPFPSLASVLNSRKEIGVCLHISSDHKNLQRTQIRGLSSNKAIHEIEEHHNSGCVFNGLGAIASAIISRDKAKYSSTLEELWACFIGDPHLEAALELLHACLTPDGLDKVSWDANGKVTIPRNGEGPFIGLIPTAQGRAEWEDLRKKTDGPFGEGYIGALTALRDELLKKFN